MINNGFVDSALMLFFSSGVLFKAPRAKPMSASSAFPISYGEQRAE